MPEQQYFEPWTDKEDGSVYRIPVPDDPRVDQQAFVKSFIKAQRAAKATQAKKSPTAQEQGGKPGAPTVAPGIMGIINRAAQPVFDAGNAVNQAIGQAGVGVAKQAVSGIPLNVAKAIGSVPSQTTPEDIGMNPTNTAQKVGGAIEQGAEFAGAAGATSGATAGLGLATRAGAQGVMGTIMGRLHGQTPEQAAVTGAVAGAGTGLTEGAWPPIKDWVTKKVTSRMLNNLMEIKPQWVEHGADPGGQVIKEGIVANSKEGLAQQLTPKLKEAGQELQSVLTTKGAGKTINANNGVITAIVDASKTIGKRSDQAFQTALAGVLDDVLSKLPAGKQLWNLTPLETQELKAEINKAITWTGKAYEADINTVLLQMYAGLRKEIVTAVPEAGPALQRWGNLKVAKDGLRSAINADKTRPIIPKSLSGTANKALNAAAGSTRAGQMFNASLTPGARLVQAAFGSGITESNKE